MKCFVLILNTSKKRDHSMHDHRRRHIYHTLTQATDKLRRLRVYWGCKGDHKHQDLRGGPKLEGHGM